MGKSVAVASVVYNLAGPEKHRPDYLKSLIMGGIIQGVDSLGEVIATGYRNGPGIRFQNFANWTRRNQEFRDTVGVTEGKLLSLPQVDLAVLAGLLPTEPGQTNRIESAEIGSGDFLYWARRHVAVHRPDQLDTEFSCDFDPETRTVTITYLDGSTDSLVLGNDYDPNARYLYARYTPSAAEVYGPIVPGAVVPIPGHDPFPSTAGWDQNFYGVFERSLPTRTVTRTEVTYSDQRPPQVHSSLLEGSQSYHLIDAQFERTVYRGSVGSPDDSLYSIRTFRNLKQTGYTVQLTESSTETEIIEGGVTRTTEIQVTFDHVLTARQYQDSTQRITHNTWLPPVIFIYRERTGRPALDALFQPAQSLGVFYPPIPFRYDNHAISKTPYRWKIKLPFSLPFGVHILHFAADTDSTKTFYRGRVMSTDQLGFSMVEDFAGDALNDVFKGTVLPVVRRSDDHLGDWFPVLSVPAPETPRFAAAYPACKKAFKRAFGGDYKKVMESINENESVHDIDYAYAVFGVSLNVEENACRKYIYKFFQRMKAMTPTSSTQPADVAAWWQQWRDANASRESWEHWKTRQGQGPSSYIPGPGVTPYPSVPWQEIEVSSQKAGVSDYQTKLRWAFITEETGRGILKTGAKTGELWFVTRPNPIPDLPVMDSIIGDLKGLNNQITLCWQETRNTWRMMTITGLHHQNFVYKNKHVFITATEALKDSEESGFLVPLHEEIFRKMGMKDRTQMGTACCFLVFNCYVEKKTPWYASTWFKVLVFAVLIVTSIAIAVASGGTGAGLLGSAISIGESMGLSGTAAIIAGASVNALAGIVVSLMISELSVALFGQKWGRAIGLVAGVVFTLGATVEGGLPAVWEALSSPEGLMRLGQASLEGVNAYLQVSTQELMQATQEMLEKTSKELAALQKRHQEEFSSWRKIDPDNVREYISELTERPEQFLTRTSMTGSDIVEATLGMLYGFPELTTDVELP